MNTPMKVNTDIHSEVADTLHPPYNGLQLLGAVEPPERCSAIHLYGPKSLRKPPPCRLNHFAGRVASNPGIHGNAVTHPPTEQLPHGHTHCLALEIPQGLIQSGQGRHQHRSAAIETETVSDLPHLFDPSGIRTDEALPERGKRDFDRLGMHFQTALTPTNRTIVRLDTNEQPARRYAESLNLGNSAHSQLWHLAHTRERISTCRRVSARAAIVCAEPPNAHN